MKRFFQGLLLAFGLLVSANSASACCLWPFGGWWGASYPSYGYSGYYSAGYPMYGTPVYSSGYTVGYGGACCAPACCCDPCCGGSCASGSCGAASTSSGSLKPTTDPNFRDRDSSDYERSTDPILNRRRSLDPAETDPANDPLPNRRTQPDPAKPDDFKAGGDQNAPLGGETDMFQNKPAVPELKDLPPADQKNPAEQDMFLPEEKADPQASRPGRTVIAEQSSRMDEVIRPRRLASRSVPAARSVSTVAGTAQDSVTPVRWISLPLPDGHARL